MSKTKTLGAPAVIAAMLLLGVTPTGMATQMPSETIEGCGTSGPRIDLGRTGIVLQETSLRVDVPSNGTYFSLPRAPNVANGPVLFICHVESGSSIALDARTGDEVARTVGDASGGVILDQLAANARVEPIAAPMTPPRTGDGGLKRPERTAG